MRRVLWSSRLQGSGLSQEVAGETEGVRGKIDGPGDGVGVRLRATQGLTEFPKRSQAGPMLGSEESTGPEVPLSIHPSSIHLSILCSSALTMLMPEC